MDEILQRKGFKELDDDLRSGVVGHIWNRLRSEIELEVASWNDRCGRIYDASDAKILFHPNPFLASARRDIAKIAKDSGAEYPRKWLEGPSFPGAPIGAVCAETVAKGVTDAPKARVYVWMMEGLSKSEPNAIIYAYGPSPDYSKATKLDIPVEAGTLVQDEKSFIKSAVVAILRPLMEAA
jgi:hypothetical protein